LKPSKSAEKETTKVG